MQVDFGWITVYINIWTMICTMCGVLVLFFAFDNFMEGWHKRRNYLQWQRVLKENAQKRRKDNEKSSLETR